MENLPTLSVHLEKLSNSLDDTANATQKIVDSFNSIKMKTFSDLIDQLENTIHPMRIGKSVVTGYYFVTMPVKGSLIFTMIPMENKAKMERWCNETFISGDWNCSELTFNFKNEADQLAFVLRWG